MKTITPAESTDNLAKSAKSPIINDLSIFACVDSAMLEKTRMNIMNCA